MKKTICLILALMLALSSVAAFAAVTKNDNTTKVRYKVEGSYEWSIPIDFEMDYVFDTGVIPKDDEDFAKREIGNWPDATTAPEGYPEGLTKAGDLAVWNVKVGGTKQVDIYMKSANGYSLKYTETIDPMPANIGYDLYFGDVGNETELTLPGTETITFNKEEVTGVAHLMTVKTGDDMIEEVLTPVLKSFRYRNTSYPTKLGTYKDTVTFYAILNKIPTTT